MIKFYIIDNPKDLTRYYLKDENGQIFFTSCGHNGRKGLKRGLEIIRQNAKLEKRYESIDGHNWKDFSIREYYFVLKAGNGSHYGTSPKYSTPQERDAALAIFKANVADAEVVDLAPEITW